MDVTIEQNPRRAVSSLYAFCLLALRASVFSLKSQQENKCMSKCSFMVLNFVFIFFKFFNLSVLILSSCCYNTQISPLSLQERIVLSYLLCVAKYMASRSVNIHIFALTPGCFAGKKSVHVSCSDSHKATE